jgi:hypothetical protein
LAVSKTERGAKLIAWKLGLTISPISMNATPRSGVGDGAGAALVADEAHQMRGVVGRQAFEHDRPPPKLGCAN